MNKKLLILLADMIREHNRVSERTREEQQFSPAHLDTLARFCAKANPAFKREWWLDYIAGKCGPNGGTKKGEQA